MTTLGHQLRRHFLREYLENDFVAPGVDQHAGAAIVMGVLVTPGIMLPLVLTFKYTSPWFSITERESASWEDKLLFILLTMIASGVVALAAWDSWQPARRDRLILGPLPVQPGVIVRARAAALSVLVLGVCVASMSVAPLLFPLVMVLGSSSVTWTDVVRLMAGHALACLLAGVWVFSGVISVNGILFSALGATPFRRVGAAVRVLGFALLAGGLLVSPTLLGRFESLLAPRPPWWAEWIPPLWFLGVWECVAGHGNAWWTTLAWRAAWTTPALAGVGLAGLTLGYTARLGAQHGAFGGTASSGRALRFALQLEPLARFCAGLGGTRAIFAFSIQVLTRSGVHRLIMAAAAGVGIAAAAKALAVGTPDASGPERQAILAVQHMLTLSIVVGVRMASAFPAELPARWILRFLSTARFGEWRVGVKRAALWGGAVPVILLTMPLAGAAFGAPVAAIHVFVGFVAASCWIDVLFFDVAKAPFSSTLEAGRGGPRLRWPLYWLASLACVAALARVEMAAVTSWSGRLALIGVSMAVYAISRQVERRRVRSLAAPQFQDEDIWDLQRLDLYR